MVIPNNDVGIIIPSNAQITNCMPMGTLVPSEGFWVTQILEYSKGLSAANTVQLFIKI
jgi:hypothetical protein